MSRLLIFSDLSPLLHPRWIVVAAPYSTYSAEIVRANLSKRCREVGSFGTFLEAHSLARLLPM